MRFRKSSFWVQKVHFLGSHTPQLNPGYGPELNASKCKNGNIRFMLFPISVHQNNTKSNVYISGDTVNNF